MWCTNLDLYSDKFRIAQLHMLSQEQFPLCVLEEAKTL